MSIIEHALEKSRARSSNSGSPPRRDAKVSADRALSRTPSRRPPSIPVCANRRRWPSRWTAMQCRERRLLLQGRR